VAVIWGSGALWARVFEILDAPPEIVDRATAIRPRRIVGAIEVRHASFTYPGQTRRAIDDVSFTVNPGQLIALVGRSGAGKTTVATLIARMIDPQLGSVHLDGHDLRDLALDSLADAVGLVFQDAFLLHASIRDNLLLGRPQASDTELTAAIEAAYLHDVVDRLPGGYNTIVGERGYRLSGGERQRMALARTILKDPPILILDEATSHLDTESEQLVQRALTGLFRGRTSIVIAHRLSTVIAADLILVLDEGRIVERGSHHELVSQGAWYASSYELQFGTPSRADPGAHVKLEQPPPELE
jgi:ATP-binding cassette subfamily B protein